MKKIIFFLNLFMITTSYMSAQQDFEAMTKAPDTYDFIRQGNIPIAKNTGALNLSIPLHNIETKDFSIPISLGYNTSSVIPSKSAGIVGHNWFLNAGGVISRRVKGIPDEAAEYKYADYTGEILDQRLTFSSPFKYFGVFARKESFSKSNAINNAESNGLDHLWRFYNNNVGSSYLMSGNKGTETLSDEFSFNFNGYSGSFFIDNVGEIYVTSQNKNNFEIDVKGIKIYKPKGSFNSHKIYQSKIVIKVDDGYTYTFGGTLASLEISIPLGTYKNTSGDNLQNSLQFDPMSSPVASKTINAWHLTKIKAPNGKTISFVYEDKLPEDFTPLKTSKNYRAPLFKSELASHTNCNLQLNVQHNYTFSGLIRYFVGSGNSQFTPNKILTPSYVLNKSALLKEIIHPRGKVEFNYTNKERSFFRPNSFVPKDTNGYINTPLNNINYRNFKLDSINVLGSHSKQINFNYKYFGKLSTRLFLDYISLKGNDNKGEVSPSPPQVYKFDYHKLTYDNPMTLHLDPWGFGSSSYVDFTDRFGKIKNLNDIILKNKYDDKGDLRYNDLPLTLGNFGLRDYQKGLVKKVTYPTGGYSKFTYEQHDYSQLVDKRHKDYFYATLKETMRKRDERAGGLRVKKIEDFDGKKATNIRTFEYKLENGASSGILLDVPRYEADLVNTSKVTMRPPRGKAYDIEIKSALFSNSFSAITKNVMDGSHIAYSRVKEKRSDGSYTISRFSDFSDYPDEPNYLKPSTSAEGKGSEIKQYLFGYNRSTDYSKRRGLLKKETSYDNLGNEIHKVDNDYMAIIPTNDTSYTYQFYAIGNQVFPQKIDYANFCLSKSTVTNYFKNGTKNQVTETQTSYDAAHNKVTKQKTILPTGKVIEEEYKYPFSNLSQKAKNVWPQYTEVSESQKNANFLPVLEQHNYIDGTMVNSSLSTYYNDRNYLLKESFGATNNTNYRSGLKYKWYLSNMGNSLMEVGDRTGIVTSYLWSGTGEYPLAEFKGLQLSNIESKEGWTFGNVNAINSSPAVINSLKNLLPSYGQYRLFSYKDGLLESITDTRNYKSQFEYDNFNRLQFVKDNDGYILTENEYKYKK